MTDHKHVRGTVINMHALGATVRLDDGRVLAVPLADVNLHRGVYARALRQRNTLLTFELAGRALILVPPADAVEPATPAPVLADARFEERMDAYLKSTEAWAPADRPAPFERHLFRKAQRAKLFRGEPQAPGE